MARSAISVELAHKISGMWVDDLSHFVYFCGAFHFGEMYLCGVDLENRVLRIGFGMVQSSEGCTVKYLVAHAEISKSEESIGLHKLGLLELDVDTNQMEIKCKTKIKSGMRDTCYEETSWFQQPEVEKFSDEEKRLFTELAQNCTENTPTGNYYDDGSYSVNIYGLATPTTKEFIQNFKHRPFQVAVLSFGTRPIEDGGNEYLSIGFGSWETGLVPSKSILWISQSQLYEVGYSRRKALGSRSSFSYHPTLYSYNVNENNPSVMTSNHRKYRGDRISRSDNIRYTCKLNNPSSIQLLLSESNSEDIQQLHTLLDSLWVLNSTKCKQSKLCKRTCSSNCTDCYGIPLEYLEITERRAAAFNRDFMGSFQQPINPTPTVRNITERKSCEISRDIIFGCAPSDTSIPKRAFGSLCRSSYNNKPFSRNILFGTNLPK